MKIVCVDNCNEKPDEIVCENINQSYGEQIVDYLNRGSWTNFYKLIDDNGEMIFPIFYPNGLTPNQEIILNNLYNKSEK